MDMDPWNPPEQQEMPAWDALVMSVGGQLDEIKKYCRSVTRHSSGGKNPSGLVVAAAVLAILGEDI
jgi:hypothetical protein